MVAVNSRISKGPEVLGTFSWNCISVCVKTAHVTRWFWVCIRCFIKGLTTVIILLVKHDLMNNLTYLLHTVMELKPYDNMLK